MDTNTSSTCPHCGLPNAAIYQRYSTVHNGDRLLYRCRACNKLFSETLGTPMEGIKSPISKVAAALKMRSEGLGLRATGRVIDSHKNTISKWERLFAGQKKTLMLYAFCHQFISLTFEGDELYTRIGKRKGDQKHKRGPKHPKYQAPQKEHPDTDQNLPDSDIHANHLGRAKCSNPTS